MNNFEKITTPNKEDRSEEKESLLNKLGSSVQKRVQESHLPTQEILGYESTVGVYGGKINYDEEERMVFDMRGVVSKIDRFGDAVLRTYDEHVTKNPLEMFKKHPGWFFKFLVPGTKRYRGTPEEINKNIERLGLEEAYGLHDWGIEIKDQNIYKAGRPLQDIYRADLLQSDDLNQIDRFAALAQSAQYIQTTHQKHGALGEVLPSDIIFQKKSTGEISQPILNIPDIVYNEEKSTSEIDKKTTDLLDFTMSIGLEELRRSEDWDKTRQAIQTILNSYGDKSVIQLLKSFIKRGRLTMQGNEESIDLSKTTETLQPLTTMHNKARLNFDKNTTDDLRTLIIEECEAYLQSNPQ
ncbi:MAG: hypothetical protein A2406_03695 [Candidatus Komeilibacteria bacterium RIFOXYC1_FULL_37_11]|uniref:Uncharacterized protein n=1 Tax=Candidatus Komeilibacteria bacterium RIFOXYC1_FULL_37_11 TaxID=1798555 RepID=A0A1G2BZK5_9BACT|nr:MAG: hypothetical protein A2406_03695 [Candidatus Komeilibacteria bacterium RIFOXYC1_FULL_37_11]OGY95201.1 MAG: hypothetical protein A2611_00640 [Candidatus Komeilibacteria bacterium RIFOXYD1_FULL_37_29]OGY96084.1 MAG: hypothetical protein A2543_01210 [Candidatus Komeilibacteria bacterium RIFOXYD2_FULL_37_8]